MRKIKRAGIVSQSTQMIENVQEIINVLMQKVYDLRFINTICFPTRRNHEQIKELASQCDVMIVIGSFTSANSKRLTQLSLDRNKRSYQVTSARELKEEMFNHFTKKYFNRDLKKFENDFLILSVLRNFKILGIFSRLAKRDDKNKYLKYIPYTWSLIKLRTKNRKVFDELRLILNNNKLI